jgi:hypothetical protein
VSDDAKQSVHRSPCSPPRPQACAADYAARDRSGRGRHPARLRHLVRPGRHPRAPTAAAEASAGRGPRLRRHRAGPAPLDPRLPRSSRVSRISPSHGRAGHPWHAAVLAGVLFLTLITGLAGVIVRRTSGPILTAGIGAIVCTMYTADTSWRFADHSLGMHDVRRTPGDVRRRRDRPPRLRHHGPGQQARHGGRRQRRHSWRPRRPPLGHHRRPGRPSLCRVRFLGRHRPCRDRPRHGRPPLAPGHGPRDPGRSAPSTLHRPTRPARPRVPRTPAVLPRPGRPRP